MKIVKAFNKLVSVIPEVVSDNCEGCYFDKLEYKIKGECDIVFTEKTPNKYKCGRNPIIYGPPIFDIFKKL